MESEQSSLQATLKQGRPFRSLGHETVVALLRTASDVRRRLSAVVEPHGITGQQYNVLRILRGVHPDPLPVLEIAERMIEETPGITGLLDRLETKGLVRRQRCTSDRRQVHCYITPGGLALLGELDSTFDAIDADVISPLSSDDARRLIELLESVRQGQA